MIKMEESKQPLDFGVSQYGAYHCFGDKATEYLSCLKQPYADISNCNINNQDSEQYLIAIFVFTDNAEVYTSEIDTFIKRYKDFTNSIFILDLHSNLQYEAFRERWGLYNIILSSSYCTLQKSILHYLLFFYHFIEGPGFLNMDICDFKLCSRIATFIISGAASSLAHPIHPIPYKNELYKNNLRFVMLGIELKSINTREATRDMNILANFMNQLPEDLDFKCQISSNHGHPHTEYVVGFNKPLI